MSKYKSISNKVSLFLLVAIFSVLMVQLNNIKENDFSSYILSSQALLTSTNPYNSGSPFQYIYPLTFLLIPLAVIPEVVAQNLWFILNLFFLFIITRNILFQLKIKDHLNIYSFLLILSILMLDVIRSNLRNGQVNIFVLLLCILFVNYYEKKKICLSSVILALAISIKLIPVIILGFILIKKDFKTFLLTIGFTTLFIMLPVVLVGEQITIYYSYYFNLITENVISPLSSNNVNTGMFFNLVGLLNFFFPEFEFGIWIYFVNAVFIFLILFLIRVILIRKRLSSDTMMIYYLFVLAILLISPMSETHHLIFLLPVVQLIAIELWLNYRRKKVSDLIIYILIIALFYLAKPIHYSLYFLLIVTCFLAYIKYVLLNFGNTIREKQLIQVDV